MKSSEQAELSGLRKISTSALDTAVEKTDAEKRRNERKIQARKEAKEIIAVFKKKNFRCLFGAMLADGHLLKNYLDGDGNGYNDEAEKFSAGLKEILEKKGIVNNYLVALEDFLNEPLKKGVKFKTECWKDGKYGVHEVECQTDTSALMRKLLLSRNGKDLRLFFKENIEKLTPLADALLVKFVEAKKIDEISQPKIEEKLTRSGEKNAGLEQINSQWKEKTSQKQSGFYSNPKNVSYAALAGLALVSAAGLYLFLSSKSNSRGR